MGIKGWIAGGVGVLTLIAVWLGVKKKEDEHYEKIQKLIRDVDQKEPEKKEELKTVEEITADVENAMAGMDTDGDDEVKLVQETFVIEIGGQEVEVTKEEYEAEIKRRCDEYARQREERIANGEWLKEVQEAANAKHFSKLETLLNEKYNPYPYHPAPADPYGHGFSNGEIDEKTYKAAQKYYGRLWNYSGD